MIPHSKPTISKDDLKAVSQVLASGMLAQGTQVEAFEKSLASRCRVKHAVAVSSGSAALHLALSTLGVGKRDMVAIPSYSCVALLHAVEMVGATPKIIDVDPSTLNLSVKDLKKKWSKKLKAVIVPHMFGFPAEIREIKQLGLPVIEDCAMALGAEYRGKPVGSWGDISVFSFYVTKVLATGEGGMLTTQSKAMADEMRDLRQYDKSESYRLRYNYKMTDMAAALGLSQLRKLDHFLKKRREIAAWYDRFLLGKKLQDGSSYPDRTPLPFRYILKTGKNVQILIRKFKKEGVTAELPVFRPLHHYHRSRPCKIADQVWKSAYSIPIYPTLTDKERRRVIEVVSKVDAE